MSKNKDFCLGMQAALDVVDDAVLLETRTVVKEALWKVRWNITKQRNVASGEKGSDWVFRDAVTGKESL